MGGWQWTRDGEKVASINLRAEEDRLHLTYRVRVGGGEWEDVVETVRIVRVACRFGGARPYLICPGIVNGIPCGRRVASTAADAGSMPVTIAPCCAIASAMKPPAQPMSRIALPGQSMCLPNHFKRPGTRFFRVRTHRTSSHHHWSATRS